MTATAAPRVLIIDNDQRICELLDINLSRRGYHVRVVDGTGPALLDAAIIQANAFRPHIAIVDLRLMDDFVDERSGLDLLPHLQSARCILYSAHLVSDVTFKAARDYNIFAWIDKYRHEDLYAVVERAAQEACAEMRGITIRWPASWRRETMVETLFADAVAIPHVSVLDDMIAQLFADNSRFHPETVSGAVGGLTQVIRGRSVVVKVYPDELQPKVLKLGNAQRIAREYQQYHRHVKDQTPGLHATQLERTVEFWDLGGAVYSFMGSAEQTLPTFTMHYATNADVATIVQPLRYFFNIVWHHHYTQMQPAPQATLFDVYDEAFDLGNRLGRIPPSLFRELQILLPVPWCNPVDWVRRFGRDSSVPNVRQAVTHGDLHGDNLFVEGDRAWIIDFERTGPGHALRDFVELEVDIYTRLADADQLDWNTLFALALTLVDSPMGTPSAHATPLIQTNSAATKALAVITEIRGLAGTLVSYSEREYLWAMLFDALFIASISSATQSQRLRALLLGAVVCERLGTWSQSWPPVDWEMAVAG